MSLQVFMIIAENAMRVYGTILLSPTRVTNAHNVHGSIWVGRL